MTDQDGRFVLRTRREEALTPSQYQVLFLYLLYGKISDYAWARVWNETLTKRGRIDGNRATGRWRTMRSLMRAGFLDSKRPVEAAQAFEIVSLSEKGRRVAQDALRDAMTKKAGVVYQGYLYCPSAALQWFRELFPVKAEG